MTQTNKNGEAAPPRRELEKNQKMALEFGPLALFGATYYFFGMPPAIAVLMAAVVVAAIATYFLIGRIPVMLAVMTGLALIFGGLSLFLQNDAFFKMKPTILYALFAAALFASYFLRKPILAEALGAAISLKPEGWRKLTLRMAFLCFGLAGLNELVWRTQSESFWVTFKIFGVPAVMIVFMLAQTPMMMRYEMHPKEEGEA